MPTKLSPRCPAPRSVLASAARAAARGALLVTVSTAVGRAEGPLGYVDPTIGVEIGSTVIGPCLPHGSIHPSPHTRGIPDHWPGNDGYDPDAPVIGFAQVHVGGAGGVPSYGQVLLSPQTGPIQTDHDLQSSPKSDEIARPDYYAVTLDRYDIRCEVTPAHHTAVYRFTYPEGVEPRLVLNVGRKVLEPSLAAGAVEIDPVSGLVEGQGSYTGNWRDTSF